MCAGFGGKVGKTGEDEEEDEEEEEEEEEDLDPFHAALRNREGWFRRCKKVWASV